MHKGLYNCAMIKFIGLKDMGSRTGFPEAVKITLSTLENGKIFSMSHLSRQTGLNPRTLEKALNCLVDVQNTFENRKLIINRTPGMIAVQLTEKSGLLSLPENLQNLVIRTLYYPTPSREQEIIVHLFIKKAFNPENAIDFDRTDMIEKLVEQGQILKTEKKYYLSDEGIIAASGSLKLYPELKELGKKLGSLKTKEFIT